MTKQKPAKPAVTKDQTGAAGVSSQPQQSTASQQPQQGSDASVVRYTDWASI